MENQFILIEGDNTEHVHVTSYTEADLLHKFAGLTLFFMVEKFIQRAEIGNYTVIGNNYYVIVRVS